MLKLLPILLLISLIAFSAHAKTLTIAYDSEPVTLDLHEISSGGIIQLSHTVCDPLIRWTQDSQFEPRLASSWQRIDENTMRFHLRKGVKFHSGRELTAKDIEFTLYRLKRSIDYKGIFLNIIGFNAIDDYTFDLLTDGPYPLVENTATYFFPLDSEFYSGLDERGRKKDEIIRHGDSFASKNISCTGPFTIASRESGVRIVFERFQAYWDTDSPGNITRIIQIPIKDDNARVESLLSSNTDFAAPIPPSQLDRVDSTEDVNLVTMSGTRIILLQMNQKRQPAFKDVRVRKAVVHAINNEGIVKDVMKDFATAAGQLSAKGYVGHNPALKPRFDLAKAKALMAEAGYSEGFDITMMSPNNRYVNDAAVAEAAVEMLAKINIRAKLTTMPKAQYWIKFDERAADIMLIGWQSDTGDSANISEFLAMTPDPDTGYGQYNSGNYSNSEVDRLVLESAKITNPDKRAAILQQVEAILHEDAAFVPLHWQNRSWGARVGVDIEPIVNDFNLPYLGDLVID